MEGGVYTRRKSLSGFDESREKALCVNRHAQITIMSQATCSGSFYVRGGQKR